MSIQTITLKVDDSERPYQPQALVATEAVFRSGVETNLPIAGFKITRIHSVLFPDAYYARLPAVPTRLYPFTIGVVQHFDIGHAVSQPDDIRCCYNGLHFCTNPFRLLKYVSVEAAGIRISPVIGTGYVHATAELLQARKKLTLDRADKVAVRTLKLLCAYKLHHLPAILRKWADAKLPAIRSATPFPSRKHHFSTVSSDATASVCVSHGVGSVVRGSVAITVGRNSMAMADKVALALGNAIAPVAYVPYFGGVAYSQAGIAQTSGACSVAALTAVTGVAIATAPDSIAVRTCRDSASCSENPQSHVMAQALDARSIALATTPGHFAEVAGSGSVAVAASRAYAYAGAAGSVAVGTKCSGVLGSFLTLLSYTYEPYDMETGSSLKHVVTVTVDDVNIKPDEWYGLDDNGNVVKRAKPLTTPDLN